MRRQRRALQVRQHSRDGVGPAAFTAWRSARRTDENAARDEQLGHVHVERGLRRTERGGRQVDQHRSAVHDDHVADVEPAVRDAGVMQQCHLPHQLQEQRVAHLVGARELQRGQIGLASDQQRVAVGAEAGGNHIGHANAGLRGHQRRQRLVLHLLEPTDGCAPRRIAVSEKPPATRDALRVLCVSAQHAYLQRPPVRAVPEILRGTLCWRSAISRSLTSTPSDSSSPAPRSMGGAPSGDPNASRTSAPAARPSASPARTSAGSASLEREKAE